MTDFTPETFILPKQHIVSDIVYCEVVQPVQCAVHAIERAAACDRVCQHKSSVLQPEDQFHLLPLSLSLLSLSTPWSAIRLFANYPSASRPMSLTHVCPLAINTWISSPL